MYKIIAVMYVSSYKKKAFKCGTFGSASVKLDAAQLAFHFVSILEGEEAAKSVRLPCVLS